MIDQNLLRKDPMYVEKMLKRRNVATEVSEFLNMDQERKMIQVQTEELQAQRNKLAKKIGMLKAKGSSAGDLMQKASYIPEKIVKLSEKLSFVKTRYCVSQMNWHLI